VKSITNALDRPQLVIDFTSFKIESPEVAGDKFNIHFAAKAGKSYVIECRDSFPTPTWTTWSNLSVQATSGLVTVPLPFTGTRKFFRVGEK
jgi:hypothetical protein